MLVSCASQPGVAAVILRLVVACFIPIGFAAFAEARSLNGFSNCRIEAPQKSYNLIFHIAGNIARFRDRVPLPITMIGGDAKFDWTLQDGRVFMVTITTTGAGASVRVAGRLPASKLGPSPKAGRKLVREEFVNTGTCTRQGSPSR